ncbi:hypothetical protein CTI12_AA573950 [Artemisia annua]|uniref:Uncharacterized protein n=1 Tax=Artemisia annua TaxID=35608 RepID=A0A2U1KR32_ARTAN|nr:hypothetical protein CTI12_AA573950 [Artemisia annua]
MEEGLVVRGRVEIDSRQPFKSVKEAVMLFGEKVLANEVYGHRLKETGALDKEIKQHVTKVAHEDEKTGEKSKHERKIMAYYLKSLTQQLEETKSELNQLKSARGPNSSDYSPIYPEVEEIKCIENPKPTPMKPPVEDKNEPNDENMFELKQADLAKLQSLPPTKVVVEVPKMQEKSASSSFKNKKAKKKTLIPLLSGIFSKSKG